MAEDHYTLEQSQNKYDRQKAEFANNEQSLKAFLRRFPTAHDYHVWLNYTESRKPLAQHKRVNLDQISKGD